MNVAAIGQSRIARFLAESVYDNPVVVRDLRSRMRGQKGFASLGGYAVVLTAALLVAGLLMWSEMPKTINSQTQSKLGMHLFMVLNWAQVVLLTLIVPSITSGSMSREVEQKTIDMLALTPLSGGKIALGKQLSAFVYALALMVTSVPLASICLILGGISPAEVAVTYALLIGWVFLLTSAGVYISTLFGKTASASAVGFGAVMVYALHTGYTSFVIFTMGRWYGVHAVPGGPTLPPLALINPGWGPYAALATAQFGAVAVPLAVSALIMNVAHGMLFLLLASSHVRYRTVEVALPARLLLLGLAVFSGLATAAGVGTLGGAASLYSMLGMRYVYAGWWGLLWCVPFCTGVIKRKPGQSMFAYALSGRKAFKSDVGGAICFMLLLMLAESLVFSWAFSTSPAFSRAYTGSGARSGYGGYWSYYAVRMLSHACLTVAVCCIGILASSIAKSRQVAAVFVSITVVLGSGLLGAMMMAMMRVTRVGNTVTQRMAEQEPFTIVVYLIISAVALALASKAHQRFGGVRSEEWETA